MSKQPSLWDTPSATSLPEVDSGALHFATQDGRTVGQSGQAPAHALASVPQEKAKGLQTLVTSGRIGSGSSASAALEQSLASRLQQRLDTAGSTLFAETWKRKATPLRRRYWEHTASAHRTSDSASISSVPTPKAQDGERGVCQSSITGLIEGTRRPSGAQRGKELNITAKLAAIPTPRGTDGSKGGPNQAGSKGDLMLPSMAALSTVSSPSARDWKDTPGMSENGVDPDGSTRSRLDQLPRQPQLATSGPTATGGTAEMASTGQLDPAYSRWLMGVPPEWDVYACTAMQSLSRWRRRSSGRISKLLPKQSAQSAAPSSGQPL